MSSAASESDALLWAEDGGFRATSWEAISKMSQFHLGVAPLGSIWVGQGQPSAGLLPHFCEGSRGAGDPDPSWCYSSALGGSRWMGESRHPVEAALTFCTAWHNAPA